MGLFATAMASLTADVARFAQLISGTGGYINRYGQTVRTWLDWLAQRDAQLQALDDAVDQVIATGKIAATTADGLAMTSGSGASNRYFLLVTAEDDSVYALYRNNAGAAVDTGKRTPSNAAVPDPIVKAVLKPLTPEVREGLRIRFGNRLYATIDTLRGFYPRKMTIPAGANVDDDLGATLVSRLVGAGIGLIFRPLGAEAGGVIRFRLGTRLLGQWSKAGGMQWSRQTLPLDCKVADQPMVNLIDRLGGASGSGSATASYLAIAAIDSNGKSQVTTRRRSDGARFVLTSGPAAYREPFVTPDNKVLMYSDADARVMYCSAEGGPLYPMDPDSIIDCWGDSLTAGAGSTGSGPGQGSYPKQLKDRLGTVVSAVNNRGIGGQTSTDIDGRHTQVALTISGNEIPASGPVAVTAYATDVLYNSGTSGSTTLTGTLAGIPGTLSGTPTPGHGTAPYVFTRATSGSAVSCPPSTPFVPDHGAQSRNRVQLLSYGRNNVSQQTQIIADLAASIAYQTAYVPRYLIGSVLRSVNDGQSSTILAVNAALLAAYPGRVVDLDSAPTTDEMSILGFEPDSYGPYGNGRTDAQDLLAGFIPSGMRAGGTDFLHLNNFGYALWALRWYRAIQAKQWFPGLTAI